MTMPQPRSPPSKPVPAVDVAQNRLRAPLAGGPPASLSRAAGFESGLTISSHVFSHPISQNPTYLLTYLLNLLTYLLTYLLK